MRILFSYTLQSRIDVDRCLRQVKDSKIPLNKCRFYYCNEDVKTYMKDIRGLSDINIVQSCGLGYDLDFPLNVMRLSKNKPDHIIIGLKNTKVTRYNEFETLMPTFQQGIMDKLCIFSTNFMYPYKKHINNHIDTRVIMCNNIHKEMLNDYVDTCAYIDNDMTRYPNNHSFKDMDVLENMGMNHINIDFIQSKNKTAFQQFFLAHLSDYI